jgi:hypothetical protein
MIEILFVGFFAVFQSEPAPQPVEPPTEQTVATAPTTEAAAETGTRPQRCRRVQETGSRLRATWDCQRTRGEDDRREHEQQRLWESQTRIAPPVESGSPN